MLGRVGVGETVFSTYYHAVRLRSELVTSSFGIFPPMAMRRLLTTARLKSWLGHLRSSDYLLLLEL